MSELDPCLLSAPLCVSQADLGRVTVHETACKGLRFCGACNVIAHGEALQDDLLTAAGHDTTDISVACSPLQV